MDRSTALQHRITFYDDERGCRNGHTPTRRYASTGNCVKCAQSRNTARPYRVFVNPEGRKLFEQMAMQFGWQIVATGGTPSRDNGAEDYSDRIPA